MHKYLVLLTILLPFCLRSQTLNQDSLNAEVKTYDWDTLKYRKFDYVLIVGLFQQHRSFTLKLQRQDVPFNTLSSQTLSAESSLIGGVTLGYDKFQFSFGTRNTPQDNSGGKGYTKTFNIGVNVGDNRWLLENYYRSFKGFYNKGTPNFDTTFNTTKQYNLQPGLTSNLFMTRLMYFTNHSNFSYKAGFGSDYRQLKSAATWILGGSFNIYNLKNDSAIFPQKAQPIFSDYGNLQGFHSSNLSIHVGAAVTIVLFKAWFINGYFTGGPEQQWRDYNLGGNHSRLSYIAFSGTSRGSMGINLKKFYLLYSITNDYNIYDSFKIMAFKSESITNNFSIGWRFHTGTPTFYKKFQQTKVYKTF